MTRFPARWTGPLGVSCVAGFLFLLAATPSMLRSQPQPGEREELVKRLEGLAKDAQNPAAVKAAVKAAEQLVAFDRAHSGPEDGRLAESLKQLSDVRAAAGDGSGAIEAAKEGVVVRQRSRAAPDESSPRSSSISASYCTCLMRICWNEAELILEQSIAALPTAIGDRTRGMPRLSTTWRS